MSKIYYCLFCDSPKWKDYYSQILNCNDLREAQRKAIRKYKDDWKEVTDLEEKRWGRKLRHNIL